MEAANFNKTKLLDSILDSALRCARSGQTIDIDDHCRKYPELADELSVMLPAIALLEKPTQQNARTDSVSPTLDASFKFELTDFEILSEIGRGAMGIVYEAIQRPLGRRVALKVMFRSGTSSVNQPARFQREAEIAARLHHTNIIPVFAAGESGGHVWYAMQFIEGVNLQQLIAAQNMSGDTPSANSDRGRVNPADETVLQSSSIKKNEPIGLWKPQPGDERSMQEDIYPPKSFRSIELTPQNAAHITLQVAEGLGFAHERGILHRDIKPSNIMLDNEGRAWIADFGLAKSNDGEALTATGDVVGTVRYIAPERFRGQSDQRSDIYALGLTLFEAIEGRPAFRETNRARLISQIMNGSISDLNISGPRDLATICFKCVQPAPADRYATANELASDLRNFLAGRPISARRLSLPTRVFRWCGRNRAIASLLALVIVGIGLSLVVSQWYSRNLKKVAAESDTNSQLADKNQLDLLRAVDGFCKMVGENRRVYRDDFQDLRNHLLKSANEIAAQTKKQANVSERAKFQLACILERLGKMSTSDDTLADSEDFLTQARDLILALSPEIRRETDVAIELAVIHQHLGAVYRRMGTGDSALKEVEESANILDRVLDQSALQGDTELLAKYELARTFSVKGDILFELRQLNESETAITQAIHLLEENTLVEPGNLDAVFELAMQWTDLGTLLIANLKKWKQAEQPLNEAIRLYSLLEVRMTDRPEIDFWKAQAMVKKAKWLYMANEPEKAIDAQRFAIEIFEEQHLMFERDLSLQVDLGKAHRQLAEFMTAQDPLNPEILELLDRSEQVLSSAVAGDSNDLPSVFSLEKTCLAYADVLMRRQNHSEALEKVDLAIQALEGLLNSNRAVPQAIEDRYFAAVSRAELLTLLSRTDEALTEWDVAQKYAPEALAEIVQIDRTRTIAWAGDHHQATEQTEAILARQPPDSRQRGHSLARSAHTFAVAARVVLKEDGNVDSQAQSDRYATRAIELLKLYKEGGGRISSSIDGQSDLSILFDRPDFQALMSVGDSPKN